MFRQGFIRGISIKSDNVNNLIDDRYNVMILCSSWDQRCKCIIEAERLKADLGILLLFDKKDPWGLREKHDRLLEGYISKNTNAFKKLEGRSEDLKGIWTKLYAHIQEASLKYSAGIDICIDISTLPRYYFLAVIATCFKLGLANKITVFYSEGEYQKRERIQQHAFKEGAWQAVVVPGLSGHWDPNKQKYYLSSVGFEGIKTLRVITRAEPQRVSILFPEPGFKEEYVTTAEKANSTLIHRYNIPDKEIVKSHAGDAIGAWRALDEFSLEKPLKENTYYLCCGTKPHALALGLRAFCLEHPHVIYFVPETHKPSHILPNGVYWRYDIFDLSSISLARSKETEVKF